MSNNVPTPSSLHVAIIPDGNRRWAKAQGWLPWRGHEQAIAHFRDLLEYARSDNRIGCLTIWCFSTENWKRDPKEVKKLMSMLKEHLTQERSSFMQNTIHFCHSGRTDRFSDDLQTLLTDIQEETKNNDRFTLHLAIDYGGQDEILRAIRKWKIAGMKEAMNDPKDVQHFLDHPELPAIDIIIRTSGEQRTSNFCLWQSTYAEWFFPKKKFPDFTPKDLKNIVDDFTTRERRFGQ